MFSLIPEGYQGVFDSSIVFENVHHTNEPHILGSINESRVDTEVQKLCRAPLLHLLREPQLAIAKPRTRSSNNRARRGCKEEIFVRVVFTAETASVQGRAKGQK